MKSPKKWIVRVLILLFWLGVFAYLAETAIRVQGNYYSWTEQNGLGTATPYDFGDTYKCWIHYNDDCDTINLTESFSHSQRFNSELLRDVEHPKEKPKGEYRIIFLGDSFTEGYGVEFDKIWHQHLSNSINAQLNNVRVRCISGGVAGSDPFFSYYLLKEKLVHYAPDLVVTAYNFNDLENVVARGGFSRFLPGGNIQFRDPPWFNNLFNKSHLVRKICLDYLGYNWYFFTEEQFEMELSKAADKLTRLSTSYDKLAKKWRFDLIFLLHPFVFELQDSTLSPHIHDIKVGLQKKSYQVIDLLPYFIEKTNIKHPDDIYKYYYKLDWHHNELGNKIFAEGVEDGLKELGYSDLLLRADSLAGNQSDSLL